MVSLHTVFVDREEGLKRVCATRLPSFCYLCWRTKMKLAEVELVAVVVGSCKASRLIR